MTFPIFLKIYKLCIVFQKFLNYVLYISGILRMDGNLIGYIFISFMK